MQRDKLRAALIFCAEKLPRRTDRRTARLSEVVEKLQSLDEEERIRLDPFATEFLTVYTYFVDPSSIPWDRLDEETLGELAGQIKALQPKRPKLYEAITVSNTKLLPIVTRAHEVLAEVIMGRVKSLRLSWEG